MNPTLPNPIADGFHTRARTLAGVFLRLEYFEQRSLKLTMERKWTVTNERPQARSPTLEHGTPLSPEPVGIRPRSRVGLLRIGETDQKPILVVLGTVKLDVDIHP
jgi:hypothetical protein